MLFLVPFKFIFVIADVDFSIDLVLFDCSSIGVYAEIEVFGEDGGIFTFYYFAWNDLKVGIVDDLFFGTVSAWSFGEIPHTTVIENLILSVEVEQL